MEQKTYKHLRLDLQEDGDVDLDLLQSKLNFAATAESHYDVELYKRENRGFTTFRSDDIVECEELNVSDNDYLTYQVIKDTDDELTVIIDTKTDLNDLSIFVDMCKKVTLIFPRHNKKITTDSFRYVALFISDGELLYENIVNHLHEEVSCENYSMNTVDFIVYHGRENIFKSDESEHDLTVIHALNDNYEGLVHVKATNHESNNVTYAYHHNIRIESYADLMLDDLEPKITISCIVEDFPIIVKWINESNKFEFGNVIKLSDIL